MTDIWLLNEFCTSTSSSTHKNPKGISFGKTLQQLFKGKCCTRRLWSNRTAKTFIKYFEQGIKVPAFDKDLRANGKIVGWLTLTQKPYQDQLSNMTQSDLIAEGFPDYNVIQFINHFFEGKDQLTWVIWFHFEPLLSPSSTMKIDIKLIRRDGGTQPRATINHLTVTEYLEDMKEGAEFPPVTLFYDGTDYWLADGFHRVEAAFGAGLAEIEAEVKQGTRRDAILYSVGANASHGLRRNNTDKRRAVMTLLEDQEWSTWSDRAIARQCGVSHDFVNRLRKSICHLMTDTKLNNKRTASRGNQIYTIDTTNIGEKASHSTEPQTVEEIETVEAEISIPQAKTDAPDQQLKIGQLVTVGGEHPRVGQSGYVTALPNLDTAIIEFEDGERELLNIENLIWDDSDELATRDEQKANPSKFYPCEGANYRPGLGCEWYVRVDEEIWNQLLKYQEKEGTITLSGAIARLLSNVKEAERFSNTTEL